MRSGGALLNHQTSNRSPVDKCRLFLNGLRFNLIGLLMYYSVEVSFRGGIPIPSYPLGSFPPTRQPPPVDKRLFVVLEVPQVLVADTGKLPHHPDHPLVTVLDRNADKAFLLQGSDVGADLPFTDTEEVGEMPVGSETTAFVVERMDFDQEHFFDERKLLREPDLPGNPHAFEIAGRALHRLVL